MSTLADFTCSGGWAFILWIVAAVIVLWSLIAIFTGRIVEGFLGIIIACLIGPGGVSLFC